MNALRLIDRATAFGEWCWPTRMRYPQDRRIAQRREHVLAESSSTHRLSASWPAQHEHEPAFGVEVRCSVSERVAKSGRLSSRLSAGPVQCPRPSPLRKVPLDARQAAPRRRANCLQDVLQHRGGAGGRHIAELDAGARVSRYLARQMRHRRPARLAVDRISVQLPPRPARSNSAASVLTPSFGVARERSSADSPLKPMVVKSVADPAGDLGPALRAGSRRAGRHRYIERVAVGQAPGSRPARR